MVLDQADVDAEFPGLPLDVEDSGYADNEAATEDTIDPNDTAADLTAGGRMDGYEHEFLNLAALFEASPAAGRPVLLETIVDLFDSQRSAQAYLQLQMEDFRRFQGIEIEGVILEEFQQLDAPDVGTGAQSPVVSPFAQWASMLRYTRLSLLGSEVLLSHGLELAPWTTQT